MFAEILCAVVSRSMTCMYLVSAVLAGVPRIGASMCVSPTGCQARDMLELPVPEIAKLVIQRVVFWNFLCMPFSSALSCTPSTLVR